MSAAAALLDEAPPGAVAIARPEAAIYRGTIRHRRHAPRPHDFEYSVAMLWLDLDNLDALAKLSPWLRFGRPGLAFSSIVRDDYLDGGAGHADLATAVRDRVELAGHPRPLGAVMLLTTPRQFGRAFNPLSLYYCFDDANRLKVIVAEITNTPWRERHAYVLPVSTEDQRSAAVEFAFDKGFHVSPFLPMDCNYRWHFSLPEQRLNVHMAVARQDSHMFDATLDLQRAPLDRAGLRAMLLRFPLIAVQTLAAIHWQALKLWLKRVPVFDHPATPPVDDAP